MDARKGRGRSAPSSMPLQGGVGVSTARLHQAQAAYEERWQAAPNNSLVVAQELFERHLVRLFHGLVVEIRVEHDDAADRSV